MYNYRPKKCSICGEKFYPAHPRQNKCPVCKPDCVTSCNVYFNICKKCGELFTAKRGNGCYCSKRCKNKTHRKRPSFICLHCGGTVPNGHRKYCSKFCEDAAAAMKRVSKVLVDFGEEPLEWPGPDYRNAQHAPII